MRKFFIIILLFPFIASHSQNLDLSKLKSPFGGKTKKQLIIKQKTIDSLSTINKSLLEENKLLSDKSFLLQNKVDDLELQISTLEAKSQVAVKEEEPGVIVLFKGYYWASEEGPTFEFEMLDGDPIEIGPLIQELHEDVFEDLRENKKKNYNNKFLIVFEEEEWGGIDLISIKKL